MTKVRAAVENKIRPSALLFQEQPNDPWTKFDFLLLESYQMLQDETCAMCGNPIWICRNENASNVGFKTKTVKCFAKAELDAYEERESKKKTQKKRHGEQTIVVPYTYDDSEFPSRMSYYEDLYRQHQAEQDDV